MKNQFMQNIPTERILQEFNYLKNNIDNNKEYETRLVPNNNLNRYSNVRPYWDTLVKINSGNKYINASWVHTPIKEFFISTQGPLDTTIDDFWEMIYQYDIKVIIMLCKLEENNKIKCAKYWDNTKINNFNFREINEEIDLNGIIIRNFEFQKKNSNNYFPKTIIQLHYTCWEDHTAPDETSFFHLLELFKLMNIYREHSSVVVHCSAGVGRTGTFIALFDLFIEIMRQINDNRISEIKFSIMETVRKLKEYRARLVENKDQYLFLYQFVNLLLHRNNLT